MKEKSPLRGRLLPCLVMESGMLCLPLIGAVVRLLAERLPETELWGLPMGWVTLGVVLLLDLLCAPLRWGRRIWYYRLAKGEEPGGSFGYAFRHFGRALLWRGGSCICRSVLLMGALAPTAAALRMAAQLRQMTSTPAVDLALLACLIVAAVSLLLLLPMGLWTLFSLWPLAETLAEGVSLHQAWRRRGRLLQGRRSLALSWWCKGGGWLLLCLLPGVGLWASARWQLHRAQWLVRRQAAVLPPMRDGVRIYIPRSAGPA